jgi:putative oxidoreductase
MDATMTDFGSLVARVCLSAVFLWSGVCKSVDRAGGIAEVATLGVPAPSLFLTLTVLCQIGCGLMVLLGFWTRLGALGLLGFTVVATLVGHRFWHLSGLERSQQLMTSLEHLAIVGGFLLLIVYGPGAFSLDHLMD